MQTDITEDTIREVALPMGFVDIKVCAVDEVWSGLKLVVGRSCVDVPLRDAGDMLRVGLISDTHGLLDQRRRRFCGVAITSCTAVISAPLPFSNSSPRSLR